MTSEAIDWEDYQALSDGTRWTAYQRQVHEIERLKVVEAWYIRVRQMIGDWYESRVGKPMTSHEADAITVMGARWRKDRTEIEELKVVLRRVQWRVSSGYTGTSAYPTCIGCRIVSHGALQTPPHKDDCVIENALKLVAAKPTESE
jgi:hypothetical protein